MRARLAILALLVSAAMAASPACLDGTARADAAQVTVVSPGGAERTLSLDALAGSEDIDGRPYVLRSSTGETAQTVSGFSLAALLEAAGADPFGFSYLEVQRPAGGSVLLSRDQALGEGAFADGPPLVYATAGGTGFLRPSAGPDDLNAADCFEAPQGVTLVLRKGEPLRVRAEASPIRTEPGKPVELSAVVERAGAGESLSYSWYFDDGHSASGPSARHSFAKRGSYDVVVGITSSGDRAGASDVVTVQVGAPTGNPDRKGGGTNEDAGAPDHGAATGKGNGSSGGNDPTNAPMSRLSPHSDRNLDIDSAEGRQGAASPAPAGERVSGMLLTSAEAPLPRPTGAVAARTGALDGDAGGGVPDAALGVLVTLSLLGTGALVEVRR